MRKPLLFAGLFFLLSTIYSCGKQGCTDPDSTNFDSLAKRDDGSCLYQGSLVFWYDKTVSDALILEGTDTLTFYVNGEIIGSSPTTRYWNSSPACGADSSVSATFDLGSQNVRPYTFTVLGQTGWQYWSGAVNIKGNACLEYHLN